MCGKNDIWYGSKICKILYKTTRQKCEQTETDLKTDRNDPLRIWQRYNAASARSDFQQKQINKAQLAKHMMSANTELWIGWSLWWIDDSNTTVALVKRSQTVEVLSGSMDVVTESCRAVYWWQRLWRRPRCRWWWVAAAEQCHPSVQCSLCWLDSTPRQLRSSQSVPERRKHMSSRHAHYTPTQPPVGGLLLHVCPAHSLPPYTHIGINIKLTYHNENTTDKINKIW